MDEQDVAADTMESALDGGEGVRPEVYKAMGRLMRSEFSPVSAFMRIADQHGYTDFETYVMLAAHLASKCEQQCERVMQLQLAAPVRYVLVTQDELDALLQDGVVKNLIS